MNDGEHARRPGAERGFAARHIGPRPSDVEAMLREVGADSLEQLVAETIPGPIRLRRDLDLPAARSEADVLAELRELAGRNRCLRPFIGLGYHECITPAVIRRNVLENPQWYTAYTPYQPEISQGRLEALLVFQTMVQDLTGLDIANASLLDEASAAAEAVTLCRRVSGRDGRDRFLVSSRCHPHVIAVVETRAEPLGIEIAVLDDEEMDPGPRDLGILIAYPDTFGAMRSGRELCRRIHDAGGLAVVHCDLLALTLFEPPGAWGADVAVGSTQRFGLPIGYGGPYAAFMAVRDDLKRQLPGRLVGVSRDATGRPALRLALQTREQHIRRDRATSNICTAQVLPAVMAAMYAVYHGPEGLAGIAARIRRWTLALRRVLEDLGYDTGREEVFDTLTVRRGPLDAAEIVDRARRKGYALRRHANGAVGVALGEPVGAADVAALAEAFGGAGGAAAVESAARDSGSEPPEELRRTTGFLEHPVFHRHRSETAMMRYLQGLASRDLTLASSMIPLGSCTMKLNAAAEMLPITEPGFSAPHPFAPPEDAAGYRSLLDRLGSWLLEITGHDAISFMPNSGAQGEYTGLLVIRAWHRSRGEAHRNVCLIPRSAHGTNPASAVLAGMRVVVVECDRDGDIDLADLEKKIEAHAGELAALMVTYPSTHGVFEEEIASICSKVHEAGGLVHLDGANMNAMVGLCRPGDIGADVCHLNLHKTFCIPHGGGGPGMGPITVSSRLAPFLPTHPLVRGGGEQGIGPIAAAPYGSPSILPISYAYIAMMGPDGLRKASEIAVLNANYVARRLEPHYPVVYRGKRGRVAHECIVDLRPLKRSAGIDVEDVAKRLMDYGFHAPTMSWPVPGTLMIEPTESEPKEELDRFCEAMIAIREEIREIERGEADPNDNLLKNAPHTAEAVAAERWTHPYSRERAAFPKPWVRERKFWPPVGRIDNAWGDRHLFCSCPPIEQFAG
ncbi:MAG: glycine dehydrogenase (aminomethyl-transferring) [Acidobacteria bacterium]|nr:MAG: glycine dehydrogenase (aminomethyl-transferring) [Acidobacteriota bacterium]